MLLCYTGAQENTMPSKVERKFDRGGDGDLLLGPQQGLGAREGGRHRERRGRVGREGERASARYRSILKREIVGMALCEGNGRMCGGASSLFTPTVGAANQTLPTRTRTRVCRPLQTYAQAPMSHCRCANAPLLASATPCTPGQQRRRRVCCRPGKRSQGRGNQMLGGLTFWALSVVTFQLPAWVSAGMSTGIGGLVVQSILTLSGNSLEFCSYSTISSSVSRA